MIYLIDIQILTCRACIWQHLKQHQLKLFKALLNVIK